MKRIATILFMCLNELQVVKVYLIFIVYGKNYLMKILN